MLSLQLTKKSLDLNIKTNWKYINLPVIQKKIVTCGYGDYTTVFVLQI